MSSKKLWGTAAFAAITRVYSIARVFILSFSSLTNTIHRFLFLECLLVLGLKAKQLSSLWQDQQTTHPQKMLNSILPSTYLLAILLANFAFLSAYWLLAAVLITLSSALNFLEMRLQLQVDYQRWFQNKTQTHAELLRFSTQENLYALSFTISIACAYFVPGCAVIAGGIYLGLLCLNTFNATWWACHWYNTKTTDELKKSSKETDWLHLSRFEQGYLHYCELLAAKADELPILSNYSRRCRSVLF